MIKRNNFQQRAKRVRNSIRDSGRRYRLSVYRSNRYISAQIIDDEKRTTMIGLHEKSFPIDKKKTASQRAKILGKKLAVIAVKKNIKQVVFDRSGYQYHGRVKALADGAREGGLEF